MTNTLHSLQHTPIMPPREGLEESVFAARWAAQINAEGRHALHDVLEHYPHPIGQREAHVAASFVCWLGTNLGKSFLAKASALCNVMPARDAGLAAWAIHNRRRNHVNDGLRTLEHLVANTFAPGSGIRVSTIEPSSRDYEVAENVAAWLGSIQGQDFLHRCEEDCKRMTREKRMRHNLTANHGMTDAAAEDVVRQSVQR